MITGGAEIMGAILLDIYTQIITEFKATGNRNTSLSLFTFHPAPVKYVAPLILDK